MEDTKMYKQITLMLLSLLLLMDNHVLANDSPLIVGQNDEIMNVKSKNISMREEEIIITLRKEYFGRIEDFGDRNQTKYKVNPNFSVNDFNEVERKNKDYLLNLEKKIPK
jgi:hypothetical protein